MITKLKIQNYKSHLNTELTCKPLTVVTGKNGAGKSSIIQSLLLLRQSYLKSSSFQEGLVLNEDLVNVGNAKDALCEYAEDNFIAFDLQFDSNINHYVKFVFPVLPNNEVDKSVDNLELSVDSKILAPIKAALFSESLAFQYIATEHIGPKETHSRSWRIAEKKGQISHKQGKAEYAIHVLSINGNKELANIQLKHEKADDLHLSSNVNAWLGEISEGVEAVIIDNKDFLKLNFRFRTAGLITSLEYKPQNVGFGISYALPVVLALLATPKDGLVLLENPEAHIHPSGQAKLAELIALAAQAGVQVVVETHSDHLINGILVACKKFAEDKKGISPDNVAIYYIDRDENSQEARTIHVPIVEGYWIKDAPSGFFDQMDIDREFLVGF